MQKQNALFAGDTCWFGNGSRVTITTRDKHLIGKNDAVYEVTTLRIGAKSLECSH